MHGLKRVRLLVCVTMLIVAALPAIGWAHSLYTYEGYDYSFNYSNHLNAGTCDNESDGNPAYVNFYVYNSNSNPYRQDDPNGSQPGCGVSGTFYSGIQKHHECEGVIGSDPCAPYVTVT